MQWLLVVNNPKRWELNIDNVTVVSAREYLTDSRYAEKKRMKVTNLCRSYRYQSIGYYVSLLAESRGHRPLPSASTMMDFKSPSIIKSLASDLDAMVQSALKPLVGDKFTLSIYFGKNMAERYSRLCLKLYSIFPSPMLRAQFSKVSDAWQLDNISPIATSDIPETHRDFVLVAAKEFFSRKYPIAAKKATLPRFDIAMLVDPEEGNCPSNEGALKLFEKAAAKLNMKITRIEKDDYDELPEYDALFIRVTTSLNHYTYRFARKAQAEGMVSIDDPSSILRCTNKVFLHELLQRYDVPTPKSFIIQKENIDEALKVMGLPMILKQPDSSFSQGVTKASTVEEYRVKVDRLLENSELLIAQEFLPTDFDWRVGIIDGAPLYVCKYYMARGHWQIYNHAAKRASNVTGTATCEPFDQVPQCVIDVSVKAAGLIGKGLYGVDVKEKDGKAYIIEVNDNPSIDAGVEDQLIGESLYGTIMQSILNRIESRRI